MRLACKVGLGREAKNPAVSHPMRLSNPVKGLEGSWRAAGLRSLLEGLWSNNNGKERLSNVKQVQAASLTGFPQIP